MNSKKNKEAWEKVYSQRRDPGIVELEEIIEAGYFEMPEIINKWVKKWKEIWKKMQGQLKQ